MKKSDRDLYLGAIQGCLPLLSDPTVDEGRPQKPWTAESGISAKADREATEGFLGALDANLPGQLSLFNDFTSDVCHISAEDLARYGLNCDQGHTYSY